MQTFLQLSVIYCIVQATGRYNISRWLKYLTGELLEKIQHLLYNILYYHLCCHETSSENTGNFGQPTLQENSLSPVFFFSRDFSSKYFCFILHPPLLHTHTFVWHLLILCCIITSMGFKAVSTQLEVTEGSGWEKQKWTPCISGLVTAAGGGRGQQQTHTWWSTTHHQQGKHTVMDLASVILWGAGRSCLQRVLNSAPLHTPKLEHPPYTRVHVESSKQYAAKTLCTWTTTTYQKNPLFLHRTPYSRTTQIRIPWELTDKPGEVNRPYLFFLLSQLPVETERNGMGFTGWGVSSGVSAQNPKQTELLLNFLGF